MPLTAAQKQALLADIVALRQSVNALVPDAQEPPAPPPPPPPPPPPAPAAVTIWPATAVPQTAAAADAASVNLGVKFRASVDGFITGIRFYKGQGNAGTHIGALWSSAGALLAQATFSGETATGWQQVNFASPVAIKAGDVYVASYLAPVGRYAINSNQFASAGVTNGPLTALQSGNGVFAYGGSLAFPSSTWNASNYWVDAVFVASGAPVPAPPPAPPPPPPPKKMIRWNAGNLAVGYVIRWGTSSRNYTSERVVGNVLEYDLDLLAIEPGVRIYLAVFSILADGTRFVTPTNEVQFLNGEQVA